jgi:hypothetical protein
MAWEHLKNAMTRRLPEAITKGAADAIQIQGKSLPVSVTAVISSGIVRVKFEVETAFTLPEIVVPVFGAEYVRLPIQVGCPGVVIAADAYLGAMSGLGSGVAPLTQPANLSALTFFPIGAEGWSSSDPNTLRLYGVTQAILSASDGGGGTVTLTANSAKLEGGGASVECAGGNVNVDGNLIINGQAFTAHTHFVASTPGNSGGVNP